MKLQGAILALLVVSAPAMAAEEGPSLHVEAGGSYENLDRGYDDWRSSYLEGAWKWGPRKTVYGGVRHTARFGLTDSESLLGLYHPLSERVTGVAEITVSPSHEVLPRWSALAQAEAVLGGGFGVQFGWRHTEYSSVHTDQGIATAEYYFGNYRAAYTYYRTYLDGDDPVATHRAALGYYYGRYGERSTIGINYANGREIESQGAGRVLVTEVRGVALAGRHWFLRDWAFTYEIGQQRVIDRYQRTAARIGVRYEF
jgi:YaiO family outer membrane protein